MTSSEKITISVLKADIGSLVGNSTIPEIFEETASDILDKYKGEKIFDYFVSHVGDDLNLIILHNKGENNREIHQIAFEIFKKNSEIAKEMNLYGAGGDLLKNEFTGSLIGMGPGVAEMEFTLRSAESIIVFAADKTESGAFNYPLFQMFANPFNTPGLVIDPDMRPGFRFEVWDLYNHKRIYLNSPEEIYDLLLLIGTSERFAIKRVYPRSDKYPKDEPVAVSSTERLYEEAGRYAGKDDPVMIVRAQKGFPAVGEILEAFSFPYMVNGWMRGSYWGPLLPVSLKNARATRFDGPPRVIALGFQVKKDKLYGPEDMFDDPAFDYTRNKALEIADYIRRHGPFEPHRVSYEDLLTTTVNPILDKLIQRFEDIK